MIYEAMSHKEEEEACKLLSIKELFVQSIATSIDALAVGVGFSFLKVNIWSSVAFIAGITFVISFIGVIIGKGAGKLLKEKAEIAGGIVPVSYTHLDVYKRQRRCSANQSTAPPVRQPLNCPTYVLIFVSTM